MRSENPVVMGVAGVGGYAESVSNMLMAHGPKATPPVRLAAVCEPAPERHTTRIAHLREQGVTVYETFEELLGHPGLEAVWLPLPIALHRPFTEQALAAGLAVMCEKPAAGTVDEVDAMIAARDQADRPVAIGFQSIYDTTTLPLKRKLLEGAIGPVRRATVRACWPRHSGYYTRAAWAGRIRHNGAWVLDSPAQNAMAHYINLPLFLLGPSLEASAVPLAVEAELYRATPTIESYDTLSARAELADGASLLVLMTHACASQQGPVIRIEGDAGHVDWSTQGLTIHTSHGEHRLEHGPDARPRMVQRFAQLVRGEPSDDIAVATLEVARAHTLFINGVCEAAPVRTVPSDQVVPVDENGHRTYTLPEIESVFERCAAEHRMLHESGLFAFTQPAGHRDLRGYRSFAGPWEAAQQAAEVGRSAE